MKTFPRALATFVALALTLAASAAFAVEYEEIINLTREGTSTRTIMQLIVQDGRAFEMSDEEMQRLKDENVDPEVIKAMLDPSYAQTWLDGGGGGGGGGYQSSLDAAYGQGYSDGQASTSLVFSFGYYYGPLSRYYYCDPFYYPFWFSGYYGYGYWPSYYASYYRPYYGWCGPYPYNYYNYGSYYCHSYYDPGYYHDNGYYVAPGSTGRKVWDNGPRWRDGGVDPGQTVGDRTQLAERAGRADSPPVVRGTETGSTRGRDLVANNGTRNGRANREVAPANPGSRSRSGTEVTQRGRSGSDVAQRGSRNGSTDVIRGGSRIDRSGGDVARGNGASRMVREGRTTRVGDAQRQRGNSRSERSWLPRRDDGSSYGVRRADGGRSNRQPSASRGVRRFDESGMGQVMNSRRGSSRGGSYDAGRSAQRMAPQQYRGAPSRGNGGGSAQMRGGGQSRGGGGAQARGGGAQMRGGGGGGGARGGGGGGMRGGGGGGGGARGGGGGHGGGGRG